MSFIRKDKFLAFLIALAVLCSPTFQETCDYYISNCKSCYISNNNWKCTSCYSGYTVDYSRNVCEYQNDITGAIIFWFIVYSCCCLCCAGIGGCIYNSQRKNQSKQPLVQNDSYY